jgi:hypothetical protein
MIVTYSTITSGTQTIIVPITRTSIITLTETTICPTVIPPPPFSNQTVSVTRPVTLTTVFPGKQRSTAWFLCVSKFNYDSYYLFNNRVRVINNHC